MTHRAPLGIALPWSTDAASWLADAQAADAAGFDFLLVPDDPDGVRPEPFALLSAAATVTRRAGLVAAVSTDFTEPYEVARQLATLDHLSDGRAGWLPRWDLFAPQDFRRGDAARGGAVRARGFVAAVGTLLSAWQGDEALAAAGVFVTKPDVGAFRYRDPDFDIAGLFNVPRSPQRHPVLFSLDPLEDAFTLRTVPVSGGDDPVSVAGRLSTTDGTVLDPRGDAAAVPVAAAVAALRPAPDNQPATLRERLGLPTLSPDGDR